MGTEPRPNPPAAKPLVPVRWDDPANVRLWLAALRSAAEDAVAAAEDVTRPLEARVLSRAEARRRLMSADAALEALLDAGERALPPSATPTP